MMRNHSTWFDQASSRLAGARPALPTIRPEQVSPNSALRLKPSTQFVVTDTEDGGHTYLIKSQHRGEAAAKQARRSWPRCCEVRRVERTETA